MRLTARLVKWFEEEQRQYGTQTALFNLLWLKASTDLHGLGVRSVKTSCGTARRRRQRAA